MAFFWEEHLEWIWRNLHKIDVGFWITTNMAEPRNVSCPRPTRPLQQFQPPPRQPKRSTRRLNRQKTWPWWILTSSCNLACRCFDHPRSTGACFRILGFATNNFSFRSLKMSCLFWVCYFCVYGQGWIPFWAVIAMVRTWMYWLPQSKELGHAFKISGNLSSGSNYHLTVLDELPPGLGQAKRTPNCQSRGGFCDFVSIPTMGGERFGKSLHLQRLVAELKVLRLVLTNWYWQELVVDFVGVQNWDQNNCDGKINGLATEPHQTWGEQPGIRRCFHEDCAWRSVSRLVSIEETKNAMQQGRVQNSQRRHCSS